MGCLYIGSSHDQTCNPQFVDSNPAMILGGTWVISADKACVSSLPEIDYAEAKSVGKCVCMCLTW